MERTMRRGYVLGVVLVLGGCANSPMLPTLLATRAGPPSVAQDRDSDGDGRNDRADRCPNEKGSPYDGCPVVDSDGDGRFDDEDRCRLIAEVWNGFEDRDGCPDRIPADLASFTGTVRGVGFDLLDKETMRPDSYPVLDRLVAVLMRYSDVRVEVSSHHASGDGDRWGRWGKDPSRPRALAVKRYLVEHGIDEGRIETRGAGPDEPIMSNETEEGRAKNRRIEVTLLVDR